MNPTKLSPSPVSWAIHHDRREEASADPADFHRMRARLLLDFANVSEVDGKYTEVQRQALAARRALNAAATGDTESSSLDTRVLRARSYLIEAESLHATQAYKEVLAALDNADRIMSSLPTVSHAALAGWSRLPQRRVTRLDESG